MGRWARYLCWTYMTACAVSAVCAAQVAGPHAPAWQSQRAQQALAGQRADPIALPAGIRIIRDVRYGDDPLETFDVYVHDGVRTGPVIFMVHGGGWRRGDKAAPGVVQNKAAHWLSHGFVFVSVNYPLLPGTPPLAQARAVAKALAIAQRDASEWGADPNRFVLMGHSSGAHLISLISAEPALAMSQGARPWIGSVALDSAAYDVFSIMRTRHLHLYDEAFGSNPAVWTAVSPIAQLTSKIAPFLAVCSSRRADSCPQARTFVVKAKQLGTRADVLPEDLSHGQIDAQLGLGSDYTASVDAFLASLDPALMARLR